MRVRRLPDDPDYRRPREEKRRKKRRLLPVILAAAIILAVTYGVSYLSYESGPQDGTTFLSSLFDGSRKGPGYPVDSPGGEVRGIYALAGRLALLNDTHLFFYTAGGQQEESFQHGCANPQAAAAGGSLLLFDRGGQSFALYEHSSLVWEGETEHQIYDACLTGHGLLAIASSGDYHLSQIQVFTERGEEILLWQSADKLVTAMSFDQEGDQLAVGCIQTQGGQVISRVEVLSLTSETPLSETALEGELLLRIYPAQGGFLILTDESLVLLSPGGEIMKKVELGAPLYAFGTDGQTIALVAGDYQYDRSYTLRSFDYSLEERGSALVESRVNGVACGAYGIYLLNGQGLQIYSLECAAGKLLPQEDIQWICPMGHYVYAVTATQIQQIDVG